MYPRVLVSGVKGGVGKTTVTLAIISILKERGYRITPFKKGPDYIDSGWLSFFAERPCYNLDSFMMSSTAIIESFKVRAQNSIAIIEGNRALFDGFDAKGSVSSAELAKLLLCPVILVVDCTKTTRSIAAVINGFVSFDSHVQIKGVVLNQIANTRHERIIKDSIKQYCSIEVVGAIPRFSHTKMPERHMGLLPYQEHEMTEETVNFIKKVSDYLDYEKILSIAIEAPPLPEIDLKEYESFATEEFKVGVIRDRVFQFYYEENLEEIRKYGAKIILINSLEDKTLPEVDVLYIGGGFPETNLNYLIKNTSLMEDIKQKAHMGLPIYAECGGLMYLCESIISEEGSYPMVGLFPLKVKMFKKPQAHGYVLAQAEKGNPFFEEGVEVRGHEFHYSKVVDYKDGIKTGFKLKRGEGILEGRDGIIFNNTLATYIHIHALGCRDWLRGIFKKAKQYRELKNEKASNNMPFLWKIDSSTRK
ncbi:MAG: cobyrinate a,c-diamide synthase [Thermodesulfovibrionaceae bacterium]